MAMAACAGFLLAAVAAKSQAEPTDSNSSEALAAAKAWLAQIDAGHYLDSYTAGCIAFHEKVPQDKWLTVLKTIRQPQGNLVSRKETGHTYKPDGFEGLDGQCMIVTYDTSFKNLAVAIEQVVVKKENGAWRGAGYIVGPKPSTDATPNAPPAPTTEIQTQPHTTAPQQQ